MGIPFLGGKFFGEPTVQDIIDDWDSLFFYKEGEYRDVFTSREDYLICPYCNDDLAKIVYVNGRYCCRCCGYEFDESELDDIADGAMVFHS